MKPSNYWCFNWFMTPKSLLIRLNDLIIRWLHKCVLSWIYFSGAICTVVCPHCGNDNKWKQTPCSFIVYEPKIKEIYSFCNGNYQNSMYSNRLIISWLLCTCSFFFLSAQAHILWGKLRLKHWGFNNLCKLKQNTLKLINF